MQINKLRAALAFWLALSAGSASAQMQRNPQLDSLLRSTDSVAVRSRLGDLIKSDKESDVNLVAQYYGRKNDVPNFERTRDIAIRRFPKGMMAYIKDANQAVGEKDPVKKEQLVRALDKNYTGHDNAMYYFDVAQTYAGVTGKNADLAKVKEYARKCTDPGFRSIVIETLLKAGHLDLAGTLARETMDTLRTPQYEMLYARILMKQQHPAEALTYAQQAYDSSRNKRADLTSAYVEVLLANNKLAQAYPMMEKFYRLGTASPEIKARLKDAYITAHGSAEGYDQLMTSIHTEWQDSARSRIAQFAVKKSPAPAFTLGNIKGETVSLETLKGKVVILDFWATWCGPCKKSFPAMQMAVNKYKDDKNVVFLFIDTWERDKDPLPGVRTFIADNKYTFNVLLDQQDPQTKKYDVVENYKVSGIPTKFVIDGNGDVVYRLSGFSGGDDAAVEELSAMIASARAGAAAKKTISVSGTLDYTGKGERMLSLMYRKLGGGYMFDSCAVKDGEFHFEKQWEEPLVVVMTLRSPQGDRQGARQGTPDYHSFLLVPGEAKIASHTTLVNATVTGQAAMADEDYQEYLRKSNLYIDTINRTAGEFVKRIADPDKRQKATAPVIDAIQQRRALQLYRTTILDKPSSPVAILALCEYAGEPVWRPRKKMAPAEIEALMSRLPAEYRSYPTLTALKTELDIAKATAPGQPIIDFTLMDTAGRSVKLSDFKGKYVFLDFWASWCVPCRKENPNVKSQFEKYKDKGFTVLSVSLDKPEAHKAWIDAIRKDDIGLWTHVVDAGGFNGHVAESYYVKSIPTNFLIGPDGRFIDRNLYGEALDSELEHIFSIGTR